MLLHIDVDRHPQIARTMIRYADRRRRVPAEVRALLQRNRWRRFSLRDVLAYLEPGLTAAEVTSVMCKLIERKQVTKIVAPNEQPAARNSRRMVNAYQWAGN